MLNGGPLWDELAAAREQYARRYTKGHGREAKSCAGAVEEAPVHPDFPSVLNE